MYYYIYKAVFSPFDFTNQLGSCCRYDDDIYRQFKHYFKMLKVQLTSEQIDYTV